MKESSSLKTPLDHTRPTYTMKFSAVLITSLLTAASAFSPSSQGRAFTARNVATDPEVSSGPSTDPVDKTLTGIDDDAAHDVFDPHAGNDPALTRNNKDEVWVSQVCFLELYMMVYVVERLLEDACPFPRPRPMLIYDSMTMRVQRKERINEPRYGLAVSSKIETFSHRILSSVHSILTSII